MFLVFIRTIKEAWVNFLRNGWLSVAAVSVMLMSLFIISTLFLMVVATDKKISEIQDKINISIYFKSDVSEGRIMEIKSDIEKFDVVKSVEYMSKEKALEDFRKNNEKEPAILRALDEIGTNPLLSSLVVKATDPSKYDSISEYVGNSPFSEEVSRVNYGKVKEVIDNLNATVSEIVRDRQILSLMFMIVSVLIIFNTIRITIYTHKQEVEIMRLVGASNTYIRLPFIFEGILYGLIATIICMLVLFLSIRFASPYITKLVSAGDLISLFYANIWKLLGLQLAAGVLLGMISSWIAVRKYLKI